MRKKEWENEKRKERGKQLTILAAPLRNVPIAVTVYGVLSRTDCQRYECTAPDQRVRSVTGYQAEPCDNVPTPSTHLDRPTDRGPVSVTDRIVFRRNSTNHQPPVTILSNEYHSLSLLERAVHSHVKSPSIWNHTLTRQWDSTQMNVLLHKFITPARRAGARFTYPGEMEGWVDLGIGYIYRDGLKHSRVVLLRQ